MFHICITVITVLISYLLTFLTTEGSFFLTLCGWNKPQEIVRLVLILIEKQRKQFNTILINFNEYQLILITCLKGTHNIWPQLHIFSSLLTDNCNHIHSTWVACWCWLKIPAKVVFLINFVWVMITLWCVYKRKMWKK